MGGHGSQALFYLAICGFVFIHHTNGGYLLTTPREITLGDKTQFCIFIADPKAPEGSIDVFIGESDVIYKIFSSQDLIFPTPGPNPISFPERKPIEGLPRPEILVNKTIEIPAGRTSFCEDIFVPDSDRSSWTLSVAGSASGVKFNHTGTVRLRGSRVTERVFIQTDKHRYQAGETVQFRVLSVTGPILDISTDNYPEIFIQTPSKTRIAQWLDVDNSQGIVHLDMKLVEEPEEGQYTIRLKTNDGIAKSQNFIVGEHVLPRFSVEIKKPSYILSIHEKFNFSICAAYTFGQPVKGNITLEVSNNQAGLCRTNIVKKENITGCSTFEFTTAEMQVTDCNVYSVNVRVTFEEEGTGVQEHVSSSLSMTRNALNFKEIYVDKYMKPNLPLTVKVRAEYPDGAPASGVKVEVCAAGKCNNMTTAPDGLFTAVLPTYKTNRIFMKSLNCRADLDTSSYSKDIEHFYSPSNSSLLIYAPEDKISCSSTDSQQYNLPVLFSATNQTSALITVQVVSRGQIQFTSTEEYTLESSPLPISSEHLVEPFQDPPKDTVRGVLNIPLTLPNTASPRAKVIVFYTRDDEEVVSDTRELLLEKCLRNTADLTWSTEQGQPGDEATLSLKSKPNSVCGLDVVDRSTLLLSEASGKISLDALFSFLDTFDISPWTNRQTNDYEYCREQNEKLQASLAPGDFVPSHYDYYSLYVDTLKMFDESGLYVFTDLTVETRPCEKREQVFFAFESPASNSGFGGSGFGGGGFAAARPPPASPFRPITEDIQGDVFNKESVGFTAEDEGSSSFRTDFPETWLWDIVVVPASGVYNQLVTLPDTVTEWVGNAVCALPNEGVGLSGETTIRTFLPFFVDLTLPPSIKRGEILPVKVSVFNYLNEALPVTVILEESPQYEILTEPAYEGDSGRRTTCLESHGKDVVTIRIDSRDLGDVNLTLVAYVEESADCPNANSTIKRRDAIIKPIKVEPEGYPREETWTKYICSEDISSQEDGFEEWSIAPPAGIVDGSDRGWVTAVGDLLALSLENLGGLIRMPYGCGEQNMLNFAPNIFIMKYLDTTKQNTDESRTKLTNFMTTGYRRELLYRHPDGAFSAFGAADDFGSTWLTAFVLKSFAQARPYILVDEASLNETRTWLHEHQDPEGCFLSIGKILHKGMQGGIGSDNNSIPLTTYVTISLLEAGEDPQSRIIKSAMDCITSKTTLDPYTMALKAYAFALAKLPQASSAIQSLLDLAEVSKNAIYWDLPLSPSKSRSVELETAAYAVLAMVKENFETYEPQVRKIVKWIMSKRNGLGGFYSTQDTVMALQAMAEYETNLYQGPLNFTATVSGTNLSHTFAIEDKNKFLQQQVSIPSFPNTVKFDLNGQGCGVFQGVLRYNIPNPEASDAFDLTVNTRTEIDRNCKTKLITACASYKLPDEKSNMVVIEVNLISGYIPVKDDLKELVRQNRGVIKRYEVDGNKVLFYIEELTSKSTCVNFKIIREVDVENVKPGTVVVYDYYKPEFFINENYILPPPDDCRRS